MLDEALRVGDSVVAVDHQYDTLQLEDQFVALNDMYSTTVNDVTSAISPENIGSSTFI